MPVIVKGRKIIEKATGRTVAVAKSHKKAMISASYRNRAYKMKNK